MVLSNRLPSTYLFQHQVLLRGLGFGQGQVGQEALQVCQVGQLVEQCVCEEGPKLQGSPGKASVTCCRPERACAGLG